MTTNWIEEFDKQFTPKGGNGISFIDSALYEYTKDIKTFITTLLEKQREEYIENIKGLQYEHANTARHGNTPDDAYDRVLNYLEYELKSHDKNL